MSNNEKISKEKQLELHKSHMQNQKIGKKIRRKKKKMLYNINNGIKTKYVKEHNIKFKEIIENGRRVFRRIKKRGRKKKVNWDVTLEKLRESAGIYDEFLKSQSNISEGKAGKGKEKKKSEK